MNMYDLNWCKVVLNFFIIIYNTNKLAVIIVANYL